MQLLCPGDGVGEHGQRAVCATGRAGYAHYKGEIIAAHIGDVAGRSTSVPVRVGPGDYGRWMGHMLVLSRRA